MLKSLAWSLRQFVFVVLVNSRWVGGWKRQHHELKVGGCGVVTMRIARGVGVAEFLQSVSLCYFAQGTRLTEKRSRPSGAACCCSCTSTARRNWRSARSSSRAFPDSTRLASSRTWRRTSADTRRTSSSLSLSRSFRLPGETWARSRTTLEARRRCRTSTTSGVPTGTRPLPRPQTSSASSGTETSS